MTEGGAAAHIRTAEVDRLIEALAEGTAAIAKISALFDQISEEAALRERGAFPERRRVNSRA